MTKAKKQEFTYHAAQERTDRILDIAMTCGFGNPLYRRYQTATDTWHELTDTGVIIIKGTSDAVVTMYKATMLQALWVAQTNHLPTYLARRILKNNGKDKKKK